MNDDLDIPPFLRKPEDGTREASASMISSIDAKVAKLAKLGLRPHPTMLGYRLELAGKLESGGPYKLRMSSMIL
jgi:hypothetical protein